MTPPPLYRWLKVAPLLQARAGPRCTLLPDGRVLVEGGRYWDGQRHTTAHAGSEIYSPLENRWERTDAPRSAGAWKSAVHSRIKHSGPGEVKRMAATRTTLPSGAVLITGGYETTCRMDGEEDDHSFRDVEVVQPGSGEVLDGGRLPSATHEHGVVVLPSGALLIIGGKSGDTLGTDEVQLGVPRDLDLATLGPVLAPLARAEFDARECDEAVEKVRKLVDAGRLDEGLALAQATVKTSPDLADAWRAVAACLFAAKRFAEAVEPLRRAVALEKDSPFELVELADALFFSGQREEAKSLYQQVKALCGEDSTWTWKVAQRAREQLQFLDLEAGKLHEVARGPGKDGSSLEWNNAGAAAMRAGKQAQARKAFERAVKVDPKNDFAWGNLASVLISLDEPQKALAAANTTLKLCHDDRRKAQAWVSKGIALFELKRFTLSVAAYDKSLALHVLPYAWNNRANSLRKLKRDREAMVSFEKACALGWHAAHWGRAAIFVARGDLKSARAAADEALRLDPSLEPQMKADEELQPLWAHQ
jgi:tetratricopeptide (TPR) repeat protein